MTYHTSILRGKGKRRRGGVIVKEKKIRRENEGERYLSSQAVLVSGFWFLVSGFQLSCMLLLLLPVGHM